MINRKNWQQLMRDQPPLCAEIKKTLQKEYEYRIKQEQPDKNLFHKVCKCHNVLKEYHITVKYDTSLQDIIELLSM